MSCSPRSGSPGPRQAGWSFQKFTKRAIDWAIVGVAVQGGRVALVNMGQQPLRASAVEQALAAGAPPAEAATHAAEGTSPPTDLNGDPAYRAHLARVLTAAPRPPPREARGGVSAVKAVFGRNGPHALFV